MNDFRDRLRAGRPAEEQLLRVKRPPRVAISRAAEEESFADVAIHREAVRLANHRDTDRHRFHDAVIEIVHGERSQVVGLVNLSGGGAMIQGAAGLELWDRVQLRFPDGCGIEAAVRWVRGDRHGLEFAEETRIDTSSKELAAMLRAMVTSLAGTCRDAANEQRSKPEPGPATADDGNAIEPRENVERELRHALIWSGQIHHDHETHDVRLRNISEGGALIECVHPLRAGADLMLDLDKAGIIFARVSWIGGDAAGLRFEAPYDLRQLARARPAVAAARWITPDHLRHAEKGNSPWRKQWSSGNPTVLQRRPGSIRRA